MDKVYILLLWTYSVFLWEGKYTQIISTVFCPYETIIIAKMCWNALSILVFVSITAGTNLRPCFSNNNVHDRTLFQPISLPTPPNNVERCNEEVNINMTPINIEQGERGWEFSRGREFSNYH